MASKPSVIHLVENRPATSPVWLNLREIAQIETNGLSTDVYVLFRLPGGNGTSTDPFPTFLDAAAYVQRVIDLIDTVS